MIRVTIEDDEGSLVSMEGDALEDAIYSALRSYEYVGIPSQNELLAHIIEDFADETTCCWEDVPEVWNHVAAMQSAASRFLKAVEEYRSRK